MEQTVVEAIANSFSGLSEKHKSEVLGSEFLSYSQNRTEAVVLPKRREDVTHSLRPF